MAFTYEGHRGNMGVKVPGTTLQLTVTSSIAAGQLVIVRVAYDNWGTVQGNTTELSVSDSQGNTYTRLAEYTRTDGGMFDGATVGLFYSVLDTALVGSTDTVTVTSVNVQSRSFAVEEFSFTGTLNVGDAATAGGSGVSPSVALSGLTSRDYLFLGEVALEENNTLAFTQDSNFSDYGTTLYGSGTAGAGTTNITGGGGYWISTAQTGETYAPTSSVTADWAAALATLYTESAGDTDELTADSVAAQAPTLGTPVLGQIHALVAAAVLTAAAIVGVATFGQTYSLDEPSGGTYLFNDEFTTTESAPLASPRDAEPGPGTLTLVQNDGELSISAGALNIPTQTMATWGDLGGYESVSRTRANGLSWLGKINVSTWNWFALGWHDSAAVADPNTSPHAIQLLATSGLLAKEDDVGIYAGLSTSTDYWLAIILGETRTKYLVYDGTNWHLLWVDSATTSPLYPYFAGFQGELTLDNLRMIEQAAPWNADLDAAEYVDATPTVNDTWTHSPDIVAEFTIDTMPTSGTAIRVAFRVQDSNNMVYAYVNDSGSCYVYERIAGANNNLGGLASGVTAGDRIVVKMYGSTLSLYVNDELATLYNSLGFTTEIDGQYGGVGGTDGGVISNFYIWPETIPAGDEPATEAVAGSDDLTASGVVAGTPSLGSPSVAQVHVLTGQAIVTSSPTLDTPGLTPVYNLASNDIILIEPSLGTPGVTQTYALSGTSVETASPVVGSPTYAEEGDLLAENLTTGAPDVGTASLSQTHELSGSGLTTTPVVAEPTLQQKNALSANGVTTGAPTQSTPVLVQIYNFSADDVEVTPLLGTPIANADENRIRVSWVGMTLPEASTAQLVVTWVELTADGPEPNVDVLAADGLSTTPVVGAPSFDQAVSLTVFNFTTGYPVLGQPSTVAEFELTAIGVPFGEPVVETPTLTIISELTADNTETQSPVLGTPQTTQYQFINIDDFVAGTPVLGTPSLSEIHALTALNVASTPSFDTPSVGQVHVLGASGVVAGSLVVAEPTIGQVHVLAGDNITSTPTLEAASLKQTHTLAADDITTAAATVNETNIGQTHTLASTGLVSTPTLGTPTAGHIHNLAADLFATSSPVVGTPALGQIHTLAADSFTTAAPTLSDPVFTQEHVLVGERVKWASFPSIERPWLGQAHHLTADGDIVAGTPIIGDPELGLIVHFDATGVVAGAPVIDVPIMGVVINFGADGITTGTPTIGTSDIGQRHNMATEAVETTPTLGTPQIGQIHVLGADDTEAQAPRNGTPMLKAYPRHRVDIPAQVRTYVVREDDREVEIEAEGRSIVIKPDDQFNE